MCAEAYRNELSIIQCLLYNSDGGRRHIIDL